MRKCNSEMFLGCGFLLYIFSQHHDRIYVVKNIAMIIYLRKSNDSINKVIFRSTDFDSLIMELIVNNHNIIFI